MDELISSRFDLKQEISYEIGLKNKTIYAKGIEDLLSESLPERITDLEISAHQRKNDRSKIIGSVYIKIGEFLNSIIVTHNDEVQAIGLFQILRNFFQEKKAPYFLVNKIIRYSIFVAPLFSFFPVFFPEVLSFYWEVVFMLIFVFLMLIAIINYKKKIFDISKVYFVDAPKKDFSFKDPQWISVIIGIISIIVAIVIAYF